MHAFCTHTIMHRGTPAALSVWIDGFSNPVQVHTDFDGESMNSELSVRAFRVGRDDVANALLGHCPVVIPHEQQPVVFIPARSSATPLFHNSVTAVEYTGNESAPGWEHSRYWSVVFVVPAAAATRTAAATAGAKK